MEKQKEFQNLISLPRESIMTRAGVGTLGEKYLHALLKRFLEPDTSFHEVKIDRYTADICRDDKIFEIQTRNFNTLRAKLEDYLELGYKVTIAYPIAKTKWISWINLETGELTKPRKSGKRGSFTDALKELYKIKFLLDKEGLSIYIMVMNIEERRNLDGYGRDKKRRSTRNDRIPLSLEETLLIEKPSDYIKLLPKGLKNVFTVKDFAKAAGMSQHAAACSMSVLRHIGVVKQVGKDKNTYLYSTACID